ncbi:hypothetical protein ABR737_01255 [Streptomyces sp. Edi2]|uniref:hypothetical protein n=1 Tax=Streptomyces sp. Edi2 TaxID=3162528 RepID=UPI0033067FA9
MKASERQPVRLRTRYTGEPAAAARTFYRYHGQHFGLVPDASAHGQRILEASLLRTLAHPHPTLPALEVAGAAYGLTGVSPGVDSLVLWPAPEHLAELLARLLPTRTPDGEVIGVPGLRARPRPTRPNDSLILARAGHRAYVELRWPSWMPHRPKVELGRARDIAEAAGREPLWETDASSQDEQRAWARITAEIDASDIELWSRALRRLGLAITSPPGWEHRPPRHEELEGPDPARIAPRARGPRADGFRGVVAVTSSDGKGGRGCTTITYIMACVLAYSGTRVGILVPDDHFGLPALLGHRDRTEQWQDIGDHLPNPRALRMATLPQDTKAAEQMIAAARNDYDVVIVDAGNAVQQRHLAAAADAVLALADGKTQWYDTETIDHRPPKPRFWEWIDDEFHDFLHRHDSVRRGLLAYLDVSFEAYVQSRAEDGETAVYDASDTDDVERWWLDYDGDMRQIHRDDDAGSELPAEEESPHLRAWRADYIAFLSKEGAERYPDEWPEVAQMWAERNRQRNLAGLAPGMPSEDEVAAIFAQFKAEIEDRALATWGQELWQQELPLWKAADEDEEEQLREKFADLIEYLHHPWPADRVVEELRTQFWDLPGGVPVVVALNHVRDDADQHQLADVTEALRGQGFAGLVLISRHPAMESWGGGRRPLHRQAVAVGWELVGQVAEALGARA